jgi:hypothetical protein
MPEVELVRVFVPGHTKPIGRIVDGVEWRMQWRTASGRGGEIVECADGPIWRATLEFAGSGSGHRTDVYLRHGMSYYRAQIEWPLDPDPDLGAPYPHRRPFRAWVKGHGNVDLNEDEVAEIKRELVSAQANGMCRKVEVHRLGTPLD